MLTGGRSCERRTKMLLQSIEVCGAGLLVLAFVFVIMDYMSKTFVQANKVATLENKVATLEKLVDALASNTLLGVPDEEK